MERSFPHHQNQTPAFLERDVSGTGQQRCGDPGRDFGQGAHRAGRHDHAKGAERTAGYGGGDVLGGINDIGQLPDLGQFQLGFMGQGDFGGSRNNQMGFNRQRAQQFEQPDTVDDARRAGDADDQPVSRSCLAWPRSFHALS